MKTETAEEMRERISKEIREDFKRSIASNWLYQANGKVNSNWLANLFFKVI